jgi:hypothetical protein
MEIVANYLVGIEMAPMMPNMVHGPKGPGAEIAVSLAEIPLEGMRRRGLDPAPPASWPLRGFGGGSQKRPLSAESCALPRASFLGNFLGASFCGVS